VEHYIYTTKRQQKHREPEQIFLDYIKRVFAPSLGKVDKNRHPRAAAKEVARYKRKKVHAQKPARVYKHLVGDWRKRCNRHCEEHMPAYHMPRRQKRALQSVKTKYYLAKLVEEKHRDKVASRGARGGACNGDRQILPPARWVRQHERHQKYLGRYGEKYRVYKRYKPEPHKRVAALRVPHKPAP
jgi:hypothetical protein